VAAQAAAVQVLHQAQAQQERQTQAAAEVGLLAAEPTQVAQAVQAS
jgi:hypothetical protein